MRHDHVLWQVLERAIDDAWSMVWRGRQDRHPPDVHADARDRVAAAVLGARRCVFEGVREQLREGVS